MTILKSNINKNDPQFFENKEKFKGTRTLVMLSGGNVDQKTFGECLAKASQ